MAATSSWGDRGTAGPPFQAAGPNRCLEVGAGLWRGIGGRDGMLHRLGAGEGELMVPSQGGCWRLWGCTGSHGYGPN